MPPKKERNNDGQWFKTHRQKQAHAQDLFATGHHTAQASKCRRASFCTAVVKENRKKKNRIPSRRHGALPVRTESPGLLY